jgi:hypothetical protein
MDIPVQVYDIRSERLLQLKEPIARAPDILPGILHPLEFEAAFKYRQVGNLAKALTLLACERFAHCSQSDTGPMTCSKDSSQFYGIGQYTANGIAGHENAVGSGPIAHEKPPPASADGRDRTV